LNSNFKNKIQKSNFVTSLFLLYEFGPMILSVRFHFSFLFSTAFDPTKVHLPLPFLPPCGDRAPPPQPVAAVARATSSCFASS
jgi:hypothetical protein